MNTIEMAHGKWGSILAGLGLPKEALSPKHGPCPLCGGTDRYRWDNKGGNGSYFCSQCGAGSGMQLLQKFKGWDFRTAACEVDKIVGNAKPDKIKVQLDNDKQLKLSQSLWRHSAPMVAGDMAHGYLKGRVPGLAIMPRDLRFAAECPVPGGSALPAMLALVRDVDGNGINVHRTFLGPNGKADIPSPRAMMPGTLPDGCAVRLARPGKALGIAEGIETALAASVRFKVPVWSAINATMLEKWIAPEGVEHVHVFGDADAKYAGQAAAFALAKRLARKVAVSVHIPDAIGTDWAD